MFKVVKLVLLIVFVYAAIYPFIQSSNTELSKSVSSKKSSNSSVSSNPNKWAIDPEDYDNEFLPDFSQFRDVKEKKRAFFGYLRPLVETINKEMVQRRNFVNSLTSIPTTGKDAEQYKKLVKRYVIDDSLSFEEQKELLLRRVDIIPKSLVLMQAANESGWGTSRFALEANNLFGQWCFTPGCGVIPRGRPDGETYEVRKFNHPIDSIRSYYNNLNTGHAYKDLREMREQLRADEAALDAELLAEGLTQYSTRRDEYVDEIQTMIRVNEKYIE